MKILPEESLNDIFSTFEGVLECSTKLYNELIEKENDLQSWGAIFFNNVSLVHSHNKEMY